MFDWFASHGISPPLAVVLVALGVVQLSLQIWAIIDLIRRPATTQRKVVAAAVIIVAGLVGALAYLAVGRSMLDDEAGSARADRGDVRSNENARRRALDQLYGPDDRK